ncbi:MAG: hypothetical protein JNK19_16285 [Tabrizicola sp.]|nr:hypothetical protein [Tabrizicola sp.]
MRKFIGVVLLGLLPGTGQACTYLEPFDISQIGGAELVLVGKVTDFMPVENSWQSALVTVEVDEVLKGEARGQITLVWNSGLAQGPHEKRARGRVLIGAMRGGRIAVTDMTHDARPDLPKIVQPLCGDVWMQPATAGVIRAAKEELR